MASTLWWLLVCVVAALAWRASVTAREAAVRTCRKACRSYELQLLDDTVALTSVRVLRTHGRLRLRRVYQFEVSSDGTDRLVGSISLAGSDVESIYLPEPAGRPPT